MIATLALVAVSFVWLVRRSYQKAQDSGGYRPEGKLRWSEALSDELDPR